MRFKTKGEVGNALKAGTFPFVDRPSVEELSENFVKYGRSGSGVVLAHLANFTEACGFIFEPLDLESRDAVLEADSSDTPCRDELSIDTITLLV